MKDIPSSKWHRYHCSISISFFFCYYAVCKLFQILRRGACVVVVFFWISVSLYVWARKERVILSVGWYLCDGEWKSSAMGFVGLALPATQERREQRDTITHQTMTTVVRSALILRFAGITTTHIIRDLKSVYVYSLQSRLGFIPSYFSIYTAKQTENWASFIWKAIYADKLPALKLCLPATEAPDATLHFPFMRRYLRKWTRCKSPSIHHAYIHSHEYTKTSAHLQQQCDDNLVKTMDFQTSEIDRKLKFLCRHLATQV